MKGVAANLLVDDLIRVSDEHRKKPVMALPDLFERIGPHVHAYMAAHFDDDYNFIERLSNLPLKAFARLTFDDLCKARFSAGTTMDHSVEQLFDKDPRYSVIRKIKNSMWQWGGGDDDWNEVVDAYDAIRRFTVPNMEVRLDYTTGWNRQGSSEFSRTFLDGIFGFLLYYRGEHVMTLGFSIMKGKRLLVQQVQLKKPKGNRWLFKLPKGHLEYFLDRIHAAFEGYSIYLVDGASVAKKNLKSYQRGQAEARERIARYRGRIERDPDCMESQWLPGTIAEEKAFKEKAAQVKKDIPRLAEVYSNLGSYQRGESLVVNHLLHHCLTTTMIDVKEAA